MTDTFDSHVRSQKRWVIPDPLAFEVLSKASEVCVGCLLKKESWNGFEDI